LAILTCPGCGRGGLRVPDGRRGKVTCPTCGAEWFHPEAIEFSAVEFRCSKSGARFVVISSRRSPLHPFVIKEIAKPAPRRTDPSVEPHPTVPLIHTQNEATPSVSLTAPKVGGWLARIAGRKVNTARAISPDPAATYAQESADSTLPITTHGAGEYNWSGFSCPYCSASSFVSCSGGHLVCDGGTELRVGRRFHQCFCGHAGYIEGTIKTFDAHHHSIVSEIKSTKRPSPEGTEVGGNLAATALPLPKKRNP
jgi:hypothetical protein